MTRDQAHNPDPNVNAHRIVAESTADHSETPTDLEGAWEKWSQSIQRVDERGMTLLRTAFEAEFGQIAASVSEKAGIRVSHYLVAKSPSQSAF